MRYLLFESAAGIAVFSIKEFDDVAKFTAELQRSIASQEMKMPQQCVQLFKKALFLKLFLG